MDERFTRNEIINFEDLRSGFTYKYYALLEVSSLLKLPCASKCICRS